MSNDTDKKPEGRTPSGPTHLLVRSRKYASFRRAGFTFSEKWQALELADLSPEKLKLLEDEPALETVRGSAREAADATGERVDQRTRAELRSSLEQMTARAEKAEKALGDLRARVESGAYAKPRSNGGRA